MPLAEVADITSNEGPNQISRDNGKRRIVVSANVRGRDLAGFVSEVQGKLESQVKMPPGYFIQYGGTFEQLASAAQRLQTLVPVSLLLIFGLLFMTFGSVKDALLVFSGVPLALTGASWPFWCGVSRCRSLPALDLSRCRRRRVEWGRHGVCDPGSAAGGVPLEAAIMQGSLLRLRPILMIGLVASLGFLPMALNTSTGAEVQRPLATVVIGGIISATVLSLLVLPALYRLSSSPDPASEGHTPKTG